MQQIQSMCGECHGNGERIDPKLRCKKCSGRKVTRERKILEVQVDKGMEDGQKISFSGEGDQVRDKKAKGVGEDRVLLILLDICTKLVDDERFPMP